MNPIPVRVAWSELNEAIQANTLRSTRITAQYGPASSSLTTLPSTEVPLTWLPGWSEDTTFSVSDAVSFALWVKDPLYRTATPSVRRTMEMEEASALLHASEREWKARGGKAYSWCRKHLEEDLGARAGGGDPNTNAWSAIRETKRAALLLDYICTVRGLRIALWSPGNKEVTIIPAHAGVSPQTPIVQFNCDSMHILLGNAGFTTTPAQWLLMLPSAKDIVWSPSACAPSAGSATVAEITEQLPPHVAQSGTRTTLWNRVLWERLLQVLGSKKCDTAV
jgi:hypothetical protein